MEFSCSFQAKWKQSKAEREVEKEREQKIAQIIVSMFENKAFNCKLLSKRPLKYVWTLDFVPMIRSWRNRETDRKSIASRTKQPNSNE